MAKEEKKAETKKGALPLMRKITAKNVMEKPIKNILKEYDGKDGDEIPLFKVGGQIVRCRPVSTQFGDSIGFKGMFIVQRIDDSKAWRGMEFFAPGTLEDDLYNAFQTRQDGQPVEFGATISLQIDSKSNTGYVFVSEPIIEAQTADALTGIAERVFKKPIAQLAATK